MYQSEELVARLRKLAERAERNEYRELVKDIVPNNDANEPFSSYRDQLGFGKNYCYFYFVYTSLHGNLEMVVFETTLFV